MLTDLTKWVKQQLETTTMQAAKQDALNTINQLPENADMEEITTKLEEKNRGYWQTFGGRKQTQSV